MNKKIQITLITLLMAFTSADVFSQALHWLSKPQSQLGPVLNDDIYGFNPQISANGRYISYLSRATNHVNAITNMLEKLQLFVYDRELYKSSWINEPLNGSSWFHVINYRRA